MVRNLVSKGFAVVAYDLQPAALAAAVGWAPAPRLGRPCGRR